MSFPIKLNETLIPIGTRVEHNSVLETKGKIIGGFIEDGVEYELVQFDKNNKLSWNGSSEGIEHYMYLFPEFKMLPSVSAIMPNWLREIKEESEGKK